MNLFKGCGVKTFSADLSAKKLVNSDVILINLIKDSFGNDIYKNNILDSKKLSSIVFDNPSKLKTLNSIIHPAVASDFKDFLDMNKDHYIIKEAAIIFETKSENNYDKIILVRAPLETRIERVMNRDKVSKKEVMKRIDNQLDESSIIDKCDYIIDNYNEEDLNERVLSIHQELSV